jgi:uncharacterized membrane protein YraQ (UPF0718 family)
VIKASLIGIPLPICSCGVLPLAMSLKKEGASKGAILSFLISTPTTGVDSIFATYSLLGGFFAAYRVLASFVTGVFAGVLANLFLKDEQEPAGPVQPCKMCCAEGEHAHSGKERARTALSYAFVDLMRDTGKWLLAGILIGGGISFFMPESFIKSYMGSGFPAMLVMLAIGIPMYVCASGSIPIAAALMMKGMNPGAAFVFLLSGPATNAAGMAVIGGRLGKKALAVYLFSIAICSLALGALLDVIWVSSGMVFSPPHAHGMGNIEAWIGISSSVILLGLIANGSFRRSR